MFVYVYIYMFICVCACIHMYIHILIYAYLFAHKHMYIYMYIFIYIYICVYMCVFLRSIFCPLSCVCSVLLCAVVCCSLSWCWFAWLQFSAVLARCVVVWCNRLQSVAECCSVLHCAALTDVVDMRGYSSLYCCSVLQCVAVCCRALPLQVLKCEAKAFQQWFAVCCSMLLVSFRKVTLMHGGMCAQRPCEAAHCNALQCTTVLQWPRIAGHRTL